MSNTRKFHPVYLNESDEEGYVEISADHPFFKDSEWLQAGVDAPYGYTLSYTDGDIVRTPVVVPEDYKEERRKAELKAEALRYQSEHQSQNELGILHGYSVSDLESKPKAKANIDWMTSLFTLYGAKLEDPTNDTPLSSVGAKPHSFEEIHLEKWG